MSKHDGGISNAREYIRARFAELQSNNIYDLLKTVDEILSDFEFVDSSGGEGRLIGVIEQEQFSHFGGQPALATMIRAYRHNPLRDTWKEYQFNVRAMIELATPERRASMKPRINWKQRCAELELESEILKAENKKLRDRLRQAADPN